MSIQLENKWIKSGQGLEAQFCHNRVNQPKDNGKWKLTIPSTSLTSTDANSHDSAGKLQENSSVIQETSKTMNTCRGPID